MSLFVEEPAMFVRLTNAENSMPIIVNILKVHDFFCSDRGAVGTFLNYGDQTIPVHVKEGLPEIETMLKSEDLLLEI